MKSFINHKYYDSLYRPMQQNPVKTVRAKIKPKQLFDNLTSVHCAASFKHESTHEDRE